MIVRHIFAVLLKDPVRRPLAAVLKRVPALKRVLLKVYFMVVPEPSDRAGDTTLTIFQDTDVAAAYIKLMEITLHKNGFTPLHTPGVNRIFAALKSKDVEGAGRLFSGETRSDLICACYLFTLRRYPGAGEISTWKSNMDRGGNTVHTLVAALVNSPEFHLTGTCCLATQGSENTP